MENSDVPADVVAAAQAGDERAFETIVTRYERSVFGLAYRMAGNAARAEDLAQEVFLRLWRKLGKFDTSQPLRPWLMRLATNACINALKRRRVPTVSLHPRGDDETSSGLEPAADGPTAGQTAETRELVGRLEEAITQLPEDYRVVVTLRHIECLSYGEIAETLGWPLGTVKVRLFRARERLRRLLLPALGEDDE